MYILIFKNHNTRVTHVEKFSPTDYCFPSIQLAEERGNQILNATVPSAAVGGGADKQDKWNAFHTMELNHFIEVMTHRMGVVI